MSKNVKTLKQLDKAAKLVNRTYHKNGPKSFKKGVGALIKVLYKNGGSATSTELIDTLSMDRKTLKDAVNKGVKTGFVTIENNESKKSYTVTITDEGEKVAKKRLESQDDVAIKILSALSEEEVAQLDAITEKIIVSCKDLGAHGKHKNNSKRHCKKHGGCCKAGKGHMKHH